MNDPAVVRTFSDRVEAEFARSLLEAEGIAASLTTEDMGSHTLPIDAASELQLLVDPADVERAKELLDKPVSEADLDAAERETE